MCAHTCVYVYACACMRVCVCVFSTFLASEIKIRKKQTSWEVGRRGLQRIYFLMIVKKKKRESKRSSREMTEPNRGGMGERENK